MLPSFNPLEITIGFTALVLIILIFLLIHKHRRKKRNEKIMMDYIRSSDISKKEKKNKETEETEIIHIKEEDNIF